MDGTKKITPKKFIISRPTVTLRRAKPSSTHKTSARRCFWGIGGAPQSVLLSAINHMIKYPTERGKFFHMGLQIVNGLTSDLWFWGYRVVVSSDIGGMGLMKVRQRWFFFNKVQSASQSVSLESRIWSAKP